MKRMWSKNEVKNLSKEVIESGQVSNAKPIYCHPITIYQLVGDNKFICTCLIFNNSSTKYTLDTYKQFLQSISGEEGRIMISGGGFNNGTRYLIFSDLVYFSGHFTWEGISSATGEYASYVYDFDEPDASITFVDGVNKIN